MGYETMLFDSRKMQESLHEIAAFIEKPVKAAITFNNLGYNMELIQGKKIWDELGIPCINILMDHPYAYKEALDDSPANGIVLCVDRNHMKYLNRIYPNLWITGYFPHAGKELISARKPIAEREIDVLYAGGLSKGFIQNIIPHFSKYKDFDAKKICRMTYEELMLHPYKTLEDALEEMLLLEKVFVDDARLCELISALHFIETSAVAYYRAKAVRVLAEAGIDVTIFGVGWENCEWISLPNVHYDGKILAQEVLKKMQDAKIVLNAMTWFKGGTHYRVFNGMLQGAVAITDTSVYMKEEFCGVKSEESDKRELLMFELMEIERLPEQVKEFLAHREEMQQIADRGYEKEKIEHTWSARAVELEKDLLAYI